MLEIILRRSSTDIKHNGIKTSLVDKKEYFSVPKKSKYCNEISERLSRYNKQILLLP